MKKTGLLLLLLHFLQMAICQEKDVVYHNLDILKKCDTSFINYFINHEKKKYFKKINSWKMFKKDREVIMFLNYFHDSISTREGIVNFVNKLKFSPSIVDTLNNKKVIFKGIVFNDGFIQVQIHLVFSENNLVKKYYHLSLLNKPPYYSNTLSYHRKLFKLLDFKLMHYDDCYNFFEELKKSGDY